jgi:hypothetical protein
VDKSKRLGDRLKQGVDVIERRHKDWVGQGAERPHSVMAFLKQADWTAATLGQALGLPEEEAAGVAHAFGFAETDGGAFRERSDKSAVLVDEIVTNVERLSPTYKDAADQAINRNMIAAAIEEYLRHDRVPPIETFAPIPSPSEDIVEADPPSFEDESISWDDAVTVSHRLDGRTLVGLALAAAAAGAVVTILREMLVRSRR